MGMFDFDYLKELNPSELAAWFLRLADFVDRKTSKVKNPLSSALLRYYIKGGGKDFEFDPPEHLKNSKFVLDVLKQHRAWYLTEKPFKGKWVGIIPRLQDGRFTANPHVPLTMVLESNVEISTDISSNTDGDNDLLFALHGFLLHTWCIAWVKDIPGKREKGVTFALLVAWVTDRYDFNEKKYVPAPNPDYKNLFGVANPVAPDKDEIIIFESNTARLEKAGLAHPFDLKSGWTITNLSIIGAAEVDPDKTLPWVPPWAQ
jgi:hypothetical protein